MKDFNIQHLRNCIGSDESTSMVLVTNMNKGKSHIEISKTVKQRFPTNEFDKAEVLYERIIGGGGRRLYKPEDLI